MNRILLCVLACITLGIGTTVYLPVRVWMRWVPDHAAIHGENITGTLGAGQMDVLLRPQQIVLLHRVRWKFLGLQMAQGCGLHWQVSADELRVPVDVVVKSWNYITIDHVIFHAPANRFTPFNRLSSLLKPQGMIQIIARHLVYYKKRLEGQIDVRVVQVCLGRIPGVLLGSYRIIVHAHNQQGQVTLRTDEGRMVLAGQGTYTVPPLRFSFAGEARLSETSTILRPLLVIFGTRSSFFTAKLHWVWP